MTGPNPDTQYPLAEFKQVGFLKTSLLVSILSSAITPITTIQMVSRILRKMSCTIFLYWRQTDHRQVLCDSARGEVYYERR